MEGLKQGERVTYSYAKHKCNKGTLFALKKQGKFLYYAKSKGYILRAVVFFDGNKKPTNVKADQLQRGVS